MGNKMMKFKEWLTLTDSRYPIEHIYSKEDLIRLADHYSDEVRRNTVEECARVAEESLKNLLVWSPRGSCSEIIKEELDKTTKSIRSLTTNSLGERCMKND